MSSITDPTFFTQKDTLSVCFSFLSPDDLILMTKVSRVFAYVAISSLSNFFDNPQSIDHSRFEHLLSCMLHSDPERSGFTSQRLMSRLWNMLGYPRTPVAVFAIYRPKIWANWKKVGRYVIQQTFDRAVCDPKGHSRWNLVKRLLLLDDKRLDPRFNDAYSNASPIVYASKAGRLDIVDLLLKYKPVGVVDPSVGNNYSIRVAAEMGHSEVVKRLLLDHRVNPSDNRNYPLRASLHNKHFKTVKVLIRDPRVDQAGRNFVRDKAMAIGHYEILEWLSLPLKWD